MNWIPIAGTKYSIFFLWKTCIYLDKGVKRFNVSPGNIFNGNTETLNLNAMKTEFIGSLAKE